jgi:fused signal recognition particle receptor
MEQTSSLLDKISKPLSIGGIEISPMAIFIILLVVAAVKVFFYYRVLSKHRPKPTPLPQEQKAAEEEVIDVGLEETPSEPTEIIPPPIPTISWAERLKKGLLQSHLQVWGKIGNILSSNKIGEKEIEEIEEILYSADLGPTVVNGLMEELRKSNPEQDLKKIIHQYLYDQMAPVQKLAPEELYTFTEKRKTPITIMIVGVNGAGKTTTIGKLATRLSRQGAKVFVGACDTFRAAAVDQLQVWCERANATMIRAKENSDPSGVAYETLQAAIREEADYCLLDTAGRLHTKANLMEELKMNRRVLEKVDPTAPQHVLLVVDAITGQNAIRQAQEFHKALSLTGIIFTKCDGSSKAGSAVGIVNELKVPIQYIGVGETVEDLNRFNLDDYLDAMLITKEKE